MKSQAAAGGQGREPDISDRVRRFIEQHINSLEELEVLLLLHRTSGQEWSAELVARELRIERQSCERRLEALAAGGLLSVSPGAARQYAYDPMNESNGAVRELEGAYEKYRLRVINLIFSKPVDKIRTFADSFRIRKEESDG